jgi:hypothetical protein
MKNWRKRSRFAQATQTLVSNTFITGQILATDGGLKLKLGCMFAGSSPIVSAVVISFCQYRFNIGLLLFFYGHSSMPH